METTVSFFSEGQKVVGTLFVPDNLPGGSKRSGIVFLEGFTRPRDSMLLPFSRYFCEKGYVCLSFDFRGFGQSEGTRWRLIPMLKVEDTRSAITFLQQQPQVDANSIGLLGTSFGGSIAIYVAAVDKRVKCVATNVPVANGRKWLQSLRSNWEWQSFLAEIEEDQLQRALTGTSRIVDRMHVMPVPAPESKALKDGGITDNPCDGLPLESAQAVIEFEPDKVVHKIAPRPVLFSVAGRDMLTPVELTQDMYDRAGEPKRFVVIPGCSHYDTYSPPYLQPVMDEALGWFEKFMPPDSINRPA